MRMLRTIGIALAAALVLLLAFLYSGLYDISSERGHLPSTRWALNTLQRRSVAVRAGEVGAPPPFDSALVADGFHHFREMCVVCHGAPGVERGEFGQGMAPTPPPLSEAAEEWSERELFWIIKHGIKLAGMPGFGPTHGDHEIWGLVAFVERLSGMTEAEYAALESEAGESGGGHQGITKGGVPTGEAAAAADDHAHAPGTRPHSH